MESLSTVSVHVVGINYTSAPIEIRESLYVDDEGCRRLLARAACLDMTEAVVLSTCNRTEIYALCDDSEELCRLLADHARIPAENLSQYLYVKTGIEAMRHLFAVGAGLDSMVIGEQQIHYQVKHAYSLASGMGITGPILNKLFHRCFRAGKRSRAETKIGEGSASVASCAADLLLSLHPDIQGIAVVIIGAGAMARAIAQNLRAAGAERITIINRTQARAQELAIQCRCAVAPFSSIAAALRQADAVLCATGSPAVLLTRGMLEAAAGGRIAPLTCIDIAMPRNIEPEAAASPGISLYDLDALKRTIAATMKQRRAETSLVDAIIEQELGQFALWFKRHMAKPAIRRLQDHFEQIRVRELSRCRKYFNPEDMEKVDQFSRSLFQKVLHHPFTKLNQCGGSACNRCTIQELFGIGPEQ